MDKIVFSHVSGHSGDGFSLRGIDLSVRENEFVTMLGAAGSGKTFLLRLLAGLEIPDEGQIWLDGKLVADAQRGVFSDPSLRDIGMIFSTGALFPHMSVYDNTAFGLSAKGYGKRRIRETVNNVLAELNISGIADRLPRTLSAVELYQAALARAIAGGAKTILIDGFPPAVSKMDLVAIRGQIKYLQQNKGLTVLLASRDDEDAFTVSTKIAILDAGELLHTDNPIELYLNPVNISVAKKIGSPLINLIPAKAQVEQELMTVQSVLGIHQFTADSFTEQTVPSPLFDCLIGIRPERIVLRARQAAGFTPAKVYSCQPMGSESIIQIFVDSQPLLIKCLGLHCYTANHVVYIGIEPESVNIFSAQTSALIKRAIVPTA